MFSKKPAAAPRQSAPMASRGSTFSVIGGDVVIKGDISASADLHIDGRVEGDIACASLVQGQSSCIQGAIEAESARIGGTVTGSITARELVVLQSARIEGDVHYDTLTIEQGATVEGRFAHRAPASGAAASGGDDDEPRLHIAS